MIPERLIAGVLEAGQMCPCCQRAVQSGEAVCRCPSCGHLQHEECWSREGRCRSYECESAAGTQFGRSADIVITAEDVARVAVPAPGPRIIVQGWTPAPAATGPRRMSYLAVSAFVCALAGAVLFGLPGLVAVVLGSVSVGLINSRPNLRGMSFAVAAIIIGLVDIVIWTAGVCLWFMHESDHPARSLEPPGISHPEQVYGLQENANIPEQIRRAIRANVLIVVDGRLSGAAGSGVVLARRKGEAVILTNRHVVDAVGSGTTTVTFADGEKSRGTVLWRAPEGIDLALVTCAAAEGSCDVAALASDTALETGSTVFAVGNPLGLGWSYVQGVISAVRRQERTGGVVRIIQMQLPLNPGNSGGGLYTARGGLIGINTFTADKSMGEGISFSIAVADVVSLIETNGGIKLQREPAGPADGAGPKK